MRRRGHVFPLVVLLALASPIANARVVISKGHTFTLDAGAFGTQLDERFSGDTNNASYVSTIAGFLRGRGNIRLGNRWLIEPSIGALIPWRSSVDGNAKTFTFQAEFDLAFGLTNWLKISGGAGIHWVMTVSVFDDVVLNNGTGTSTFYAPGGISNAFSLTADAGIELLLSRRLSINLDVYVASPADSLRRRLHGAITVGYRWGK